MPGVAAPIGITWASTRSAARWPASPALLLTGRMNAGHPTAGLGMEFDAIAAVIVGGTSFERGNGWLGGTLLGVIAVGVLKNGLNVLAVPVVSAGREHRRPRHRRARHRSFLRAGMTDITKPVVVRRIAR